MKVAVISGLLALSLALAAPTAQAGPRGYLHQIQQSVKQVEGQLAKVQTLTWQQNTDPALRQLVNRLRQDVSAFNRRIEAAARSHRGRAWRMARDTRAALAQLARDVARIQQRAARTLGPGSAIASQLWQVKGQFQALSGLGAGAAVARAPMYGRHPGHHGGGRLGRRLERVRNALQHVTNTLQHLVARAWQHNRAGRLVQRLSRARAGLQTFVNRMNQHLATFRGRYAKWRLAQSTGARVNAILADLTDLQARILRYRPRSRVARYLQGIRERLGHIVDRPGAARINAALAPAPMYGRHPGHHGGRLHHRLQRIKNALQHVANTLQHLVARAWQRNRAGRLVQRLATARNALQRFVHRMNQHLGTFRGRYAKWRLAKWTGRRVNAILADLTDLQGRILRYRPHSRVARYLQGIRERLGHIIDRTPGAVKVGAALPAPAPMAADRLGGHHGGGRLGRRLERVKNALQHVANTLQHLVGRAWRRAGRTRLVNRLAKTRRKLQQFVNRMNEHLATFRGRRAKWRLAKWTARRVAKLTERLTKLQARIQAFRPNSRVAGYLQGIRERLAHILDRTPGSGARGGAVGRPGWRGEGRHRGWGRGHRGRGWGKGHRGRGWGKGHRGRGWGKGHRGRGGRW